MHNVKKLKRNLLLQSGPCLSCCRRIIRSFSTTINESQIPTTVLSTPNYAPSDAKHPAKLSAGVLLTRSPQITRPLTSFEKSFYLYQRRLNERLALSFPRYFYIKRGTPADVEWKRKIKARMTPARDIGIYYAYGKDKWNDELLLNAKESEPEHQVNALLEDARPVENDVNEDAAIKDKGIESPTPRVTNADKASDEQSLNRLLDRSLHLLVKDAQSNWRLPSDVITVEENLHQAAERVLLDAGGINMNTWLVGKVPIGHHQQNVFFLKARIMAGQLNLNENKLGILDFKWIPREDIGKLVGRKYWASIRNMIPVW